ncbi:MAG TPA: phage minor head protein [Gemmatimonadales bacterium]|nr:phage minor head protein [Gemmatimonadales bacterium]
MAVREADRLRLILQQFPTSAKADVRALLRSELRRGLDLGENPLVVAKRISKRSGFSLVRAQTIARTEMMHAEWVRTARDFGGDRTVTAWQWQTTSSNPCEVCAVLEGRTMPRDEPLNSHPNCRCTMVPVVVGLKAPISRGQSGPSKIRRMSHAKRTALLGPRRADFVKNGGDPESLLTTTTHPVYGTRFILRPVTDLTI